MKYFVVVETPTSGDYWLKSEKPEFTRNYNDKMLITEQDAKQFQSSLLGGILKMALCSVHVKEDSEESWKEFREKWFPMEVQK